MNTTTNPEMTNEIHTVIVPANSTVFTMTVMTNASKMATASITAIINAMISGMIINTNLLMDNNTSVLGIMNTGVPLMVTKNTAPALDVTATTESANKDSVLSNIITSTLATINTSSSITLLQQELIVRILEWMCKCDTKIF